MSTRGQIQWQQKPLNELHQQMKDWELAFEDTTPKHILVCEIVQEEFRRRMLSLKTNDNADDPDSSQRESQTELITQFINARLHVRNKALFDYHKLKFSGSYVKEFRNDFLNEKQGELLAHLLEPGGVAEQPPRDIELFLRKYFMEEELYEYLEKKDAEAKARTKLMEYYVLCLGIECI